MAETKYASSIGKATNSGDSSDSPWDVESCYSKLSPGDKCIYADGNYGGVDLVLKNSGIAGKRISHECAVQHKCIFDRLIASGNHLNIKGFFFESNFYDSTKSATNPRADIDGSFITFDSIIVRGEPNRCADGNPEGNNCQEGDKTYNNYNDLFEVHGNGILITGDSQFLQANHAQIQFKDDGDDNFCERDEIGFAIIGSKDNPIEMEMDYHHNLEIKGACKVLVEYVDFKRSGSGRGDFLKGGGTTIGEAIHSARGDQIIIRFSTFSYSGSGTDEANRIAAVAIGGYSNVSNGISTNICMPHNSFWRLWGSAFRLARTGSQGVALVDNVRIVNQAIDEVSYLNAISAVDADSPFENYIFFRTGETTKVDFNIDGIVARDANGGNNKFLYDMSGGTLLSSFSDIAGKGYKRNGVLFGPDIVEAKGPLFNNAESRDFSPRIGGELVNKAVPVAQTTAGGSGTVIPVDFPQCFMDEMTVEPEGVALRPSGDVIDIGGKECVVTDVNLDQGTISCASPIDFGSGAAIYYKVDGRVLRDIGAFAAVSSNAAPSPPQDVQITVQ